jgi:tetratricopeptide (TPR) repeat protein
VFGWLQAEHEVLRQAIEQAADEGFVTAAWQLYYLFAHSAAWQGMWAEYEAAGRTALAAATRAGDDTGLGWIYSMLATFHAEFGTEDQVLTERRQALEHFERAGNTGGQAYAHRFLSDALCKGGVKFGANLQDDLRDPRVRHRASEGLTHAEQAVVLYRQLGNQNGVMWALCYSAYHHGRLRSTEVAGAACRQARKLAAETGDPHGDAFACFMMGFACQADGDLDGAIANFLEALRVEPEGGPASFGARAEYLGELGETYLAAGDIESARGAWQQALDCYEALAHPAAEILRVRLSAHNPN